MPSVTHLHLATAHRSDLTEVSEVLAVEGMGLEGDRYLGTTRNVTIVAEGELQAAATQLGYPILPGSTRRNITVDADRLPRETGTLIRMGEATLSVWRDCPPCERMYQTVGPKAREALAGKSGIAAQVVKGGMIRVGDPVHIEPSS
ncbi:MAG: MOSC domain-containing protein [bacterium]|nr:MOSC domain-containing protein [Acidimicrobiia bacterium]MCY4649596.1 MOSC domain-containing protein [bacterium]